MNTKYTRQMNSIRRALGIGAVCLVASIGVVHAESIAIPSARPMIDGIGADVETVSSSNKVQHHVSADVGNAKRLDIYGTANTYQTWCYY